MDTLYRQVLVSRIKSYIWRAGGVAVIALLSWVVNNLSGLELPVLHMGAVEVDLTRWLTMGLGLVLGEVTKYYNDNKPWLESQGR